MPLEIHKLRRLSVYFTNGEALTLELIEADSWNAPSMRVERLNGEIVQFTSAAVAYWRLLPFERAVEVGAPPKPVKPPEPELELR